MRSLVSKSFKHFPTEWSINSLLQILGLHHLAQPYWLCLLTVATRHPVAPNFIFFPHCRSTCSPFFQQHLLNTCYLPSPILGTSLFGFVCLLFVCLQSLLPPLIPKTGIYSSFKIQSNCLFLHEKILWNFLQFPHVNFYDTLLKLLIYQMLLLDSGPLQHKESDLYFCNQSSD